MKLTNAAAVLSCDILRFVRDHGPSEAELLAWLGDPASARIYHVLRNAGLVTARDGRVELSPRHLAPDGKTFVFDGRRWHVDVDQVDVFSAGPATPAEGPTF